MTPGFRVNIKRIVFNFLYDTPEMYNPICPALYYAWYEGDLDIVEYLLKNYKLSDGQAYLLCQSCKDGQLDLATLLATHLKYTREQCISAIYYLRHEESEMEYIGRL